VCGTSSSVSEIKYNKQNYEAYHITLKIKQSFYKLFCMGVEHWLLLLWEELKL
jgi:hypothetical protein